MTNANSSVSSFYHNLSHLKWPINNKSVYPVYRSKSCPVNSQMVLVRITSQVASWL